MNKKRAANAKESLMLGPSKAAQSRCTGSCRCVSTEAQGLAVARCHWPAVGPCEREQATPGYKTGGINPNVGSSSFSSFLRQSYSLLGLNLIRRHCFSHLQSLLHSAASARTQK
jgi:hypothetical protein